MVMFVKTQKIDKKITIFTRFSDIFRSTKMEGVDPYKFWRMAHNCTSTCNCLVFSDDSKAILQFENKTFEGHGANMTESMEIAAYKLFYNHFHLTSPHWNDYRTKDMEFDESFSDVVNETKKDEIRGKIYFICTGILQENNILNSLCDCYISKTENKAN